MYTIHDNIKDMAYREYRAKTRDNTKVIGKRRHD
jgi:hypothetical protein